MKSIGSKIGIYRKEKQMTQEELANQLGVSAQAVSKWENDLSCPDIRLLVSLSKILGITLGELLSNEEHKEVFYVQEEERKAFKDLILKVMIDNEEGDKIRINLPLPLLQVALELGTKLPQFNQIESMKELDIEFILTLVQQGAIGKLVEIQSKEDTIIVVVE